MRPGPSPRRPDDDLEASYFPSAGQNAGQRASWTPSNASGAQGVGTPTTELPPALPPLNPPASRAQHVHFRPLSDRNQSAIRLRRLRGPAQTAAPQQQIQGGSRLNNASGDASLGQGVSVPASAMKPLPPIPGMENEDLQEVEIAPQPGGRRYHFLARRRRAPDDASARNGASDNDCYDSRIVDFLDVIDPEVATLSSITNIQNSLFVPSLGRWVNRRPTYDLSQIPRMPGAFPQSAEDVSTTPEQAPETAQGRPPVPRVHSFSTVLSTTPQYAILPDDATLEGWHEEDIKLLNDYVRHMLHSKRSKVKQRLKGFGQYAKRPLGFLVTLYATLITLFGLAWVLFLIGWIYVGDKDKQDYGINIIDLTLVALFAIVGDGLAPFRIVDTYHMIYVAHYHRKTWKLRKKLRFPELQDHNDLPTGGLPTDNRESDNFDLEAARTKKEVEGFFPVLTEKEQESLVRHQTKLAKSHTFYKPHETETHHAFPLRLLIAVVLLLDLHSCLQICLGSVTWSYDYEHRPVAVTTTVLCCSITANLLAGVLISIGDRRTRKKDVLERLLKQELTGEVMNKMQKEKEKEVQREKEDGRANGGLLGINLPWPDVKGRKSEESDHRKSSDGNEFSNKKNKEKAGRFDAAVLGRVNEESH